MNLYKIVQASKWGAQVDTALILAENVEHAIEYSGFENVSLRYDVTGLPLPERGVVYRHTVESA